MPTTEIASIEALQLGMNYRNRQIPERRAVLVKQRNLRDTEAERIMHAALGESRALQASEQRTVDQLDAEVRQIEAEIEAFDAGVAHREELGRGARRLGLDLSRTSEHTYRSGGEHSFFVDLARAVTRADSAAAERLALGAIEARSNSRLAGAGGEFVPPMWLEDQYAPLARPGRVSADLCTKQALPAGTNSISIPKVTGGSSIAWQTADNAAVASQDLVTAAVTAPVLTAAGQVDLAVQLLDQSPIAFDEMVYGDLRAQMAQLEGSAVLTGAGTAGAIQGLWGLTGAKTVAYTTGSPTVPGVYSAINNVIQQIQASRYLPPEALVMHPRRWAWFLAAVDGNQRPLVVPDAQGAYNSFAVLRDVAPEGVVGTLCGLPVVVDPNVPTTITGTALTGGTQDAIFVCRWSDLYLWESELYARAFPGPLSGTLTVRLQLYRYVAFAAGRYPQSVGYVNGTGLVSPTF
jgi:HK97 family phage major capsid protein